MKYQSVTPERLAAALMQDVYQPFSSCVWLDGDGNILGLRQFDTEYYRPAFEKPKGTACTWLMSNHPEGYMKPYARDLQNIRRLRADRLFIVSEDEGMREIPIRSRAV